MTLPLDRPWLARYPAGIPAQIDSARFASLKDMFAASSARYAELPAFQSMGAVLRTSTTLSYCSVGTMSVTRCAGSAAAPTTLLGHADARV